ncbi:MAG: hypothetical protein LBH59_10870 [Planctomycetaceae bacterium]|nr:hypothetical protein [Planctomycetaceae bacterium]
MRKNNNAYCRVCVEGCSGGLCFRKDKAKQFTQRKKRNTPDMARKVIILNLKYESNVFVQNLRNEKCGVDLL